MIDVVTAAEMAAIDADAPEPVDELVERAGAAVAWAGRRRMGGTYGRRVVVVAGPGNNGADGRSAARRLRRWGAAVDEVDATTDPERVPTCDLVIDAAFGTGLNRDYHAPAVPAGTPVLAVDIPSGFHGDRGTPLGRPVMADHTVTFAAPTPGLLFDPCRSAAGHVEVVDIGLDTSRASMGWVEDADVARWVPARSTDHHKWKSAVAVVGGAPGMRGAAALTSLAALRAGAGYVRWYAPGGAPDHTPLDVVSGPFREDDLAADARRWSALAVGPGLGTGDESLTVLAAVLATDRPVVVDADGLTVLARNRSLLADRTAPTILTPHDGELRRLIDGDVGPDRIDTVREAAATYGAVVLSKGPTTVIADPGGAVRLVTSGTSRLAVAGTGDVLTGVIAAFVARGAAPLDAAAGAAHGHGRAGAESGSTTLVASELPARVGATLRRLGAGP